MVYLVAGRIAVRETFVTLLQAREHEPMYLLSPVIRVCVKYAEWLVGIGGLPCNKVSFDAIEFCPDGRLGKEGL
jgi:hypothetical protein